MTVSQLALPLRLADHAVFASFLSDGNHALVATLTALADGTAETGCWLWGGAATGKTHLLQAPCERAGDRAVYIPLATFADADPALFDVLAIRELACIADLAAVSGQDAWEQALLELCNELLDVGGRLVVAASAAPRRANIALPDLVSRLSRLPVFQVQTLGEAERGAALQLRARHRGLELPDETARYLLSRSRRDMTSLYNLLDKLDAEALRAKRRLTIPFVKAVIEDS